jgi:hypothetical protein
VTRRARAIAALLVALAATAARSADAEEEGARSVSSAPIAVVCDAADPFGGRLVAELTAIGFRTVILAPGEATASRASLELAARRAGAIAAIRAVPSERGVEVWIADRVTGKTVLREMESEGGRDRDGALALRVVELLRASVLEITLPAAPRGEVPPPPAIREKLAIPPPTSAPPPKVPALRLSLAPAALLSPGGVGAGASLDIGLAWMPSEHFGLSAFAAIPLTAARFEGAVGGVDLRVFVAGGGVRFLFTSGASRWAPTLDLGLAGLSIKSAGARADGSRSATDSAAAPTPFARLGLAFAITSVLRARADVLTGAIVQGVSVHFAGEEVARWGRPFAMLGAGIDFGWF